MNKSMVGLVLSLMVSMSVNGRAVQVQKDDSGTVRVFVFTAESGGSPGDSAAAARVDSMKDLQAALRSKSGLSLVDGREQADVMIEVLDRGDQETGETVSVTTSSPVTGTPHTDTTRSKDAVVRVKLVVGDEVLNLQGSGSGDTTRRWRTAANNVAKVIERWIKAHRASVMAARAKR